MSSGSGPHDEFEQMLTASHELRARYRAASQEEPSAQVDDAVLASAHRAVRSRPRLASSPFASSWRVPLSIAAVLVVSVTVTLMVVRDERHLPSAEQDGARRKDAPAAVSAPPSATASSAARTPAGPPASAPPQRETAKPSQDAYQGAPPQRDLSAQSEMEKRKAESPPSASAPNALPEEAPTHALKKEVQPFPATPPAAAPSAQPAQEPAREAQAPPPAPKSDQLRDSAISQGGASAKGDLSLREEERYSESKPSANVGGGPQVREQKAQDKLMRQRSTAPLGLEAPRTPGASAAAAWESDPQLWLRHIEQLVREQRMTEARESLRAFRLHYPSYPLPAEFPLREP